MQTLVLKNNARDGASGQTYTIQVVGDSAVKDAIRDSIKELEYHPAKASQRSLIDMLALIEKHNMQIRFTEHTTNEEGLEEWLFILQG